MSAPEFTPGPWQVKRSGCISARGDGQLVATTGYRVAVVEGTAGAEDSANAALIAAAPDLFAALSDVLAKAGGDRASCGHPYTCSCAFDAARAALAKARGE